MSSLFSEYDTGVGWSFGLEIDGITMKEIQSVDGLVLEADTIELRHNTPTGSYVNKQLPGRKKIGQLSFTRGITDDKTWEGWINNVFQGNMVEARKNGTVNIYNYAGQVVRSYNFVNGWPSSISISTMTAGDTSVLTETLTMVHEGLSPAT